jgi:DNA invertase Pin-like site-specific DNA recombinase
MKHAVGYLRVSTQEQGRSGLSLAAQHWDIERFSQREGFSVISWHQDIQTGAGKDALLLRPGLAAALEEARAARCPLIVSRLDRLSRNVHFITGLMEHKVHFVVALFGRDVDDFTLHIYASIAEQERKMIAERVRAATLIAKAKGRKFGLQLRPKSWQRYVSALGRAALVKEANDRAEACRLYIEWALKQPGRLGRAISFRGAAIKLMTGTSRRHWVASGGVIMCSGWRRVLRSTIRSPGCQNNWHGIGCERSSRHARISPLQSSSPILEPRIRSIFVGPICSSRSAVERLQCEVMSTGTSTGISIIGRRLESASARCGSGTRR